MTAENGQNGQPQTRVGVATGGGALVVLAVRLPPSAQRTPRVAVDLALGPVALVVTVAKRRQRGRLDVRLPLAADGGAGVVLPADLQAEVEAAALLAVRTNPEARAYLTGGGR